MSIFKSKTNTFLKKKGIFDQKKEIEKLTKRR